MDRCSLCQQIAGLEEGDLISQYAGRPYVRRVAWETSEFAALPSLGPLARGHLLLCPKLHVRSFAALPLTQARSASESLFILRKGMKDLYGAPIHCFEHGNADQGARFTCSTEHAHIHLVPAIGSVRLPELGHAPWNVFSGSIQDLKGEVAGKEYISYFEPGGKCWLLVDPNGRIPSQVMRRALAETLGDASRWDWKSDPQIETVLEGYAELYTYFTR